MRLALVFAALLMSRAEAALTQTFSIRVSAESWTQQTTPEDKRWIRRIAAQLPADGILEGEFGAVRVCLGPDSEAACTHHDWSGSLPELYDIVAETYER